MRVIVFLMSGHLVLVNKAVTTRSSLVEKPTVADFQIKRYLDRTYNNTTVRHFAEPHHYSQRSDFEVAFWKKVRGGGNSKNRPFHSKRSNMIIDCRPA